MIECFVVESRLLAKEVEWKNVRQSLKEMEGRVDYLQFERLCQELQRALDREKEAQDLLNEQNEQLKALTNILHQTEEEKNSIQDKYRQLSEHEKNCQEKVHHLTRSHDQMEENVKRAEKAIRMVVNDKEQISLFCQRIHSALNLNQKKQGVEQLSQLLTQLHALIQLPSTNNNNNNNNRSPPELTLCQVSFSSLFSPGKEMTEWWLFSRCLSHSSICWFD